MTEHPHPWVGDLHTVAATTVVEDLRAFVPPPGHHRRSAVLMLFGHGPHGPEVLLTERAAGLRQHAGQVSFPGGALDPTDDGPLAAALREAQEETGLDPAGVQVIGALPDLYLVVSDFAVTPVLAFWHTPSPVAPVDPVEVARVAQVPVAELTDPANRLRVRHPSGYIGPAFAVRGLLVWGFTAALLDRLIALAGWELPWDESRVEPLPAPEVEP